MKKPAGAIATEKELREFFAEPKPQIMYVVLTSQPQGILKRQIVPGSYVAQKNEGGLGLYYNDMSGGNKHVSVWLEGHPTFDSRGVIFRNFWFAYAYAKSKGIQDPHIIPY